MNHKSKAHPASSGRGRTTGSGRGHLWGNVAFLVLGAAVLTAMVAIGAASQSVATASASGAGGPSVGAPAHAGNGPSKPTCGDTGLPACAATPRWIKLHSEAPGDIVAAARQSPLFTVDRSGNGDYVKDLSHLGTPQLVRALHAATGPAMPDFYVVPVDDGAGNTVAAAELQLDAGHGSVLVTAIVTYTKPHAHDALARVDQAAAVSAVAAQHHTALRAGARPELVYFPVDAAAQQTGQIKWVSGGEYPADPLWLVPGADGQDHVVGADGHVFSTAELPISSRA